MYRIAGALGAVLLSMSAAVAADAVVEEVVVLEPTASWSGLYLGAQAGYAWGNTEVSKQSSGGGGANLPWNIDTDADGWLGGIQAGYDYQMDRWVFGAVADIDWADVEGSGVKTTAGPPADFSTDFDWIATIRGRIGYLPADNFLVYAHGGFAFADMNINPVTGAGPWGTSSFSDTETGWVAGVGVEYLAWQNISVFGEYSYIDFGDGSFPALGGPTPNIDYDNQLNVFKIGINYRFQ